MKLSEKLKLLSENMLFLNRRTPKNADSLEAAPHFMVPKNNFQPFNELFQRLSIHKLHTLLQVLVEYWGCGKSNKIQKLWQPLSVQQMLLLFNIWRVAEKLTHADGPVGKWACEVVQAQVVILVHSWVGDLLSTHTRLPSKLAQN